MLRELKPFLNNHEGRTPEPDQQRCQSSVTNIVHTLAASAAKLHRGDCSANPYNLRTATIIT